MTLVQNNELRSRTGNPAAEKMEVDDKPMLFKGGSPLWCSLEVSLAKC
jgi:hypothetical protein